MNSVTPSSTGGDHDDTDSGACACVRGAIWYRCNGRLTDRGPIAGRCSAKSLKGANIEVQVWGDVERYLRDPGDILEELSRDKEMDPGAAIVEAERVTLESALLSLKQRRKNAIDLSVRGQISDGELDELLMGIINEQKGVNERLEELQSTLVEQEEPLQPDLLEELRRKLDEGMDDTQRQEIVKLLVKRITIYTEVVAGGKKMRLLVEYRFPAVVNNSTGRDSWR